MLEAVGEVFPEAKYQRCVVHFYRNVFSVVPKSKVKLVAKDAQGDPCPGEQKSCP
jgi:transposase-like protein